MPDFPVRSRLHRLPSDFYPQPIPYQEPAESSGSAVTKQSWFATLATLVERLSQSHY